MEDFQSDETVPKDRDKLNRDERQFEMEDATPFSIWLEMPSGPEAVLVFKDVMRRETSSLEQEIEDKRGVDDFGLVWIKSGDV